MKNLMNRTGLLAAASALALAIALALNSAAQTPAGAQIPDATHTPTPTHTPERFPDSTHTPTPTATYTPATGANPNAIGSDTDGNGLIEITTPAQLNAMRWDLDGDGNQVGDGDADLSVPSADRETYFSLLRCRQDTTPAAVPPPSTCVGYELMNDISLASYKNSWTPIGPHWQAVFNGNGFSVTGLEGQHGLFGNIGILGNETVNAKTVVKNVDVVGAKITLAANKSGGVLARANYATIIGSYVTGEVTGGATESVLFDYGGLVGINRGGTIAASVADVNVKVTSIIYGARVGGLVGINTGDIHRSYAYGNIIDARTANDRPRSFRGFGFAVNHSIKEGTIDSSLSYGNKIVTNGDGKDAAILENSLAQFAKGSAHNGITLITNSCPLPDESQFTCPTPTPSPTSTPTPTTTPTPTPTSTPTTTPTSTSTPTPTPTQTQTPTPTPTSTPTA